MVRGMIAGVERLFDVVGMFCPGRRCPVGHGARGMGYRLVLVRGSDQAQVGRYAGLGGHAPGYAHRDLFGSRLDRAVRG